MEYVKLFIDIKKANNKCMKDYDKNTKSSYLIYWDVNNVHGWAMSQKLPVDGFAWNENASQFNEDFIKNFDVNGHIAYFLLFNVKYPEQLHETTNDLPFLLSPERMETGKLQKLEYSFNGLKNTLYMFRSINIRNQ